MLAESLEVSYNDYYGQNDIELGNVEVDCLDRQTATWCQHGISRWNNDDCFRRNVRTTQQNESNYRS